MPFTLSKSQRLKSKKRIEQLFTDGHSARFYPIRVVFLSQPDLDEHQAGFSVSKRNFKRAVDRMKIKRLMREAYRLQRDTQLTSSPTLAMMFIYTGKKIESYERVYSAFAKALQEISTWQAKPQ